MAFFGKSCFTAKIFFVFNLYQSNLDITLIRWFKIQRVDPVIISPINNSVQCFVVIQREHGFGNKKHKGDPPSPVVIHAKAKLLIGERVQPVGNSTDLLVNDLRGERSHHRGLASATLRHL